MKCSKLLFLCLFFVPNILLSQVELSFDTQNISNALNSGTYIEFTGTFVRQSGGPTDFYLKYDESLSSIDKSFVSAINNDGSGGTYNYSNGVNCPVGLFTGARIIKFRVNLPANLECGDQQSIRINLEYTNHTSFDYFTLTFTMKDGLHITGMSIGGSVILCNGSSEVYYLKDSNNNSLSCQWSTNPNLGRNYLVGYGIHLSNNSTNNFLETLTGTIQTGVGCKVSKEIWFGKPNFHFDTPGDYCNHVPQTEHIIYYGGQSEQQLTGYSYSHQQSSGGQWFGGDYDGASFRGASASDWVSWDASMTNTCGSTPASGYATFMTCFTSNEFSGESGSDLNIEKSDNLKHEIMLSPNPASGGGLVFIDSNSLNLFDSASEKNEDLTITLFSIDGKIVQEVRNVNSQNISFHLKDNLAPGIYLISLSSNTELLNRGKIVIN